MSAGFDWLLRAASRHAGGCAKATCAATNRDRTSAALNQDRDQAAQVLRQRALPRLLLLATNLVPDVHLLVHSPAWLLLSLV